MCKIWTQEVKISKSYDRNKFAFVFFKERVYIQCVMYCKKKKKKKKKTKKKIRNGKHVKICFNM